MSLPERKIIHIDMDCFYAAVEMRDRPDLREKPMAVGGRPESRGVITTCNYKAREFNVHSALSSREAVRRCPDLVILPNRFQKYKDVSNQIKEIYKKYSDQIETISLDEAYLDLTNNKLFDGNATKTARALRQEISDNLGITASAGIASNKFLAKIASDWKKPNNQLTIQPHEVENFIKTLPLKKIPGVGKSTLLKLRKQNLETCADLQKFSLSEMNFKFGSFGERLFDLCRGVDNAKVHSQRKRKSISVETTVAKDITEWPLIKKKIESLFTELVLRMKKANIDNKQIKTLNVKFKSSDFQITSKEKSLNFEENSFLQIAEDHFLESNFPVRLIGLGCKLDVKERKKSRNQLNLF